MRRKPACKSAAVSDEKKPAAWGYVYEIQYQYPGDKKERMVRISCGSPDEEVAKKQALTILDVDGCNKVTILGIQRRDAPPNPYLCPICLHDPVKPTICTICGSTLCAKHIETTGACGMCVEEVLENSDGDFQMM